MDIELVMLEVSHSDRAELEAVMRGAEYTVHKVLGHSFPLAELLLMLQKVPSEGS